MDRKKILIVAYDWPPRNSIAVHRPYSWAVYWSRAGHDVTVMTAKKCSYDEPLDLELPLISGVTVHEVSYRSFTEKSKGKAFLDFFFDFLKKRARLLKRVLGLNIDIRDSWSAKAIPVVFDLHEENKFDAVISTYGPRSCHFIASELKKVDPKIYWVADYRDMWSIRHDSILNKRQAKAEKSLELKVIAGANLLTTVSDPLVCELKQFTGKNTKLIFNGYDIDNTEVKKRINLCRPKKHKSLRIVYTGMIYPRTRDPSPLFSAINELVAEQVINEDQVLIEFFGGRQFGLEGMISTYNASSYVKVNGHVSRQQALFEQERADLLLLMESGDSSAKGVLTGKVFEYMVSGKPILSLGSTSNSAIGELIKSTGIGVVCENDVLKIKKTIMAFFTEGDEAGYSPKIDEIMLYSREKQSLKLLEYITDASC